MADSSPSPTSSDSRDQASEVARLQADLAEAHARLHTYEIQLQEHERAIVRATLAEQQLRESEQRLKTLLEHAPEALVILDIDAGRFADVNDNAVRLYGVDRETLLTLGPAEISPPFQPNGEPSDQAAMQYIRAAVEGGKPTFEWEHRRADGTTVDCEVRLVRLPSSTQTLVRGSVIDISDRKRDEAEREKLITELEAKNEELERFTYTVSHDLKTPLVTIKGFLGLLQQDVDRADMASFASDLVRIDEAADKMTVLLDELLELSRVGRKVNPFESIHLSQIAAQAVELAEGSLQDRPVTITIQPDMPMVFLDRLRLQEVFQNLIENAIKYRGEQPDFKITIGSRSARRDESGVTMVTCFVRDNGLGIDPRYHDRIFELFERLNPRVPGTGVGLALVKRIIESFDGTIWVESDGVGHGSAFCFTLPLPGPAA